MIGAAVDRPGKGNRDMYMSYCKYEGTAAELRRCLGDADDHINEEAQYTVSENEIKHFRRMVTDFYEWMEQNDLLTNDGELDEERLDYICETMKQATDEEYDD